ncbi:MAG TPA: carbohydrate binding domain-containing protein [Terriglobales bacterium]|nr:carbohydrate binding domain-containing protein [Terriglobales bacterium]
MTPDPGSTAAAHPEVAAAEAARALPVVARIALLVAALAVAGLYLRSSSRVYRAFRWAEGSTLKSLETAAKLEPMDAEFRYRLGKYSLLMQDFSYAIAQFKSAIALNSYNARYWLDLAGADLATDNLPGARQALARALEADPTMPDVVWQAANYELVQGDADLAMQRLHDLVEHAPETLPATLNVCWPATRDPDLIAEKVLPARPEAYFTFINFLRNKRRPEASDKVWSHLIALKQPFPVHLAFPYLDYLISRGEFARAQDAWAQLAIANHEFRRYVPSEDGIVNGGFELDVLNGGLDWRYSATGGASVIIDLNRAHTGNRSLAITFDGAPEDSGVFQLVPVRGNTRYQFSGFMMAEDLETASPPRFAVHGLRGHKSYVLTDGVNGSTGWQQLQGEFTTGLEDDLLLVHIVRVPSQRLIRGKVWVDDVKLVAQPRAGALP